MSKLFRTVVSSIHVPSRLALPFWDVEAMTLNNFLHGNILELFDYGISTRFQYTHPYPLRITVHHQLLS